MSNDGHSIERVCRIIGCSPNGYHAWKNRPPSERSIRHAWLTDLIMDIHSSSSRMLFWLKHSNMSTQTNPTGLPPDEPLGDHPGGRSHGRRNAGCRRRSEGGDGLGNGGVEPPKWTPVYKIVAEAPNRPIAARNGFATLARALLAKRIINANEHALYNVLLDRSNNKAKSVAVPVRKLVEITGWGESTVKKARNGLEDVGLLIHHNRSRNDIGGVRIVANRYGFDWNHQILEEIRWSEHTAIKQLGAVDAAYHPAERQRQRREIRERAINAGKAQADRARIIDRIGELIAEHDDYQTIERIVNDTWSHDPELCEFAQDLLASSWEKYQAGVYGQQLAGLDISPWSRRQRIEARYGHDRDLADYARLANPHRTHHPHSPR